MNKLLLNTSRCKHWTIVKFDDQIKNAVTGRGQVWSEHRDFKNSVVYDEMWLAQSALSTLRIQKKKTWPETALLALTITKRALETISEKGREQK